MKWPSIPQPDMSPAGMQQTALALKENVEIMQGVRGQSPFLLASTMEQYDNQLADLRKKDEDLQKQLDAGYRLITNRRLTGAGGPNEFVYDLEPYAVVRMDIHGYFTPSASTLHILASNNNGASWYTAAGSYAEAIVYSTNNTSPPVTSTGDTGSPAGWGWRIGGFGGALQVNAYGVRAQLTMMGMEDNYTTVQGSLTYINTTPTLLYGHYTGRIGTKVNALNFAASFPLRGRIVIEGILK